jgi:hypothetical protein
MAGFSDYLEDKVLDHVFGGVAYTAPTKLTQDKLELLLFQVQIQQQQPTLLQLNTQQLQPITELWLQLVF